MMGERERERGGIYYRTDKVLGRVQERERKGVSILYLFTLHMIWRMKIIGSERRSMIREERRERDRKKESGQNKERGRDREPEKASVHIPYLLFSYFLYLPHACLFFANQKKGYLLVTIYTTPFQVTNYLHMNILQSYTYIPMFGPFRQAKG